MVFNFISKKSLTIFGICIVLLTIANASHAQYVKGYNIPDSTYKYTHSPHKATFYSAIIPGMGQVYNKKYWKVPIIYAGFGGLIYYAQYNNYVFERYRNSYNAKVKGDIENDEFYNKMSEDVVLKRMDEWRRYRDLCIIGIGILYVAQILDANVDAHLFDYDISEDLSLRVDPYYMDDRISAFSAPTTFNNTSSLGLRCTIRF